MRTTTITSTSVNRGGAYRRTPPPLGPEKGKNCRKLADFLLKMAKQTKYRAYAPPPLPKNPSTPLPSPPLQNHIYATDVNIRVESVSNGVKNAEPSQIWKGFYSKLASCILYKCFRSILVIRWSEHRSSKTRSIVAKASVASNHFEGVVMNCIFLNP